MKPLRAFLQLPLPSSCLLAWLRIVLLSPERASAQRVNLAKFQASTARFYLDGKLTHKTDTRQFPHGAQRIWLTSVVALWGAPVKSKAVAAAMLPARAEFAWARFDETK